ncbi:MAG: hypothetical protein ACI97A_001485, partial [Planctomycetota bacterium]
LLKEKGGRGFPYVTLMNAKGDVLWEFWPEDKAAFDTAHNWASKLTAFMTKAAATPEDKALAASASLLDACGRQQRPQSKSFADLEACAKVEGVNAEIMAMYKPKRIEMAMAAAQQDGGKAILDMFKAGERPTGSSAIGFYYYGSRAAITAKDAENANKMVDLFEAAGAKNERFRERAKTDAAKMREEIKAFAAPAEPAK